MNLYNDCDPFAAEWLKSLVDLGCIPEGVVDGRKFQEIEVSELVRYRQCHWFCGIAGWPEALRLAGLRDVPGIWTQSLPCQPISVAGKRGGEKDERHLWPEFYSIVSECRPAIMFGEQSGSKDGREWIDGISLDLEELGYAVGSSDLCVAGIGGPHIRQRIYWGAVRLEYAKSDRWKQWWSESGWSGFASGCSDGWLADSEHNGGRCNEQESRTEGRTVDRGISSGACRLADTSDSDGRRGISGEKTGTGEDGERRLGPASSATACRLGDSSGDNERRNKFRGAGLSFGIAAGGSGSRLGDSISQGLEGYAGDVDRGSESGRIDSGEVRSASSADPWGDWYPVYCRDGKTRRVGRAVQPLAHGVPRKLGSLQSELEGMGLDAKLATAIRKWAGNRLAKSGRNRVGRLRGYGNAIVPLLAAEFVRMFLTSVFESIHCENGG